MKKYLATAYVIAAFIPAVAFADVTLDQLLAQIKALQAQIVQLQGSASTAGTTTAAPSLSCDLPTQTLKKGISGDAVTRLQQFLARDTSVYPEGTVSGFYGQLTELAVQRWQMKNGIVFSGSAETTGFGAVGPRTLAAMRDQWCLQSLIAPSPFTPSQTTTQTSNTTNTTNTSNTTSSNSTSTKITPTNTSPTTTATVLIPALTPQSHIIFTSPAASTSVSKGGIIAIAWATDQTPVGATVVLSLQNKAGQNIGIVKNNLNANGTYYWSIPAPQINATCTSDPITCLSQIAATPTGCTSLCTLENGLYKLYAQLIVGTKEIAHAESRIFSVGGASLSATDITSTGTTWNFTANSFATSSYAQSFIDQNIPSNTTSNSSALMCTYSGVPYTEGITLTVNCADVTAPGQTCGALGGLMLTCKSGQWVDQNGVSQSVRNISNNISTGSCITPWMAQMVANGNEVPREPFFTNGQYTLSVQIPLMKCNKGVWQTCSAIGDNCH